MLETLPLHEIGGQVAGAVLTLHAPSRIGERLSAFRNYDAGDFEAMQGDSPEIERLKQRAARMAVVDAPLLITARPARASDQAPPGRSDR